MQDYNKANQPNDALADDIWAIFGAASKIGNYTPPIPESENNAVKKHELPEISDLAAEILGKLEQKKETATSHLGISAAEVETMPFDLSALEQAGNFPKY